MKILLMVPDIFDTAPGLRFRIEQWMPFLEKEGIEFAFSPFKSPELHKIIYKPGHYMTKSWLIFLSYLKRVKEAIKVCQFDAVFLKHEAAIIGPAIIETLIHRSKVPIIYDMDDAYFVRYISPTNKYFSYLKFPGKTDRICKLSAHIVVGNSYLRDYALQHNSNVTIIPTTIDTKKYTVKEINPNKEKLTIGWTGSHSTLQHLDTLKSALLKLRNKHPFKLHVIGGTNFDLPGVEVYAQDWKAETEVSDLHNFDIGIMPLPDNEITRGKCGLKALQCMAIGIPTVCSPVGVNSEIIQDGVNGFLASTDDEWVEKLSLLIESPELQIRLGQAGRKTVEEWYSAEVQVPRMLEVLRFVVRK